MARSQSWYSESSGLDRLGVDSCFECQCGNLATADTFGGRVPSARGLSWTCTCTCPVGLTGDVSASWARGREIINSFCAQREVFAKFACELGWIKERTRLGLAFHAEGFCGVSVTLVVGGKGGSEKRPFSCSSVPKVFAIQHWNVCGWVEGGDCFSFSDFWSFGADDRGRSVAVAWAALSDDLERVKDIFESDDCSICVQRPGVEGANCQMFSNNGLFASTWSWRFCVPPEGQADAAICTPCCGWRDENRQRLLILHSAL